MRIIDYRFLQSLSFSQEQADMLRDIYLTNDRLESWKVLYPETVGICGRNRIIDDIVGSHSIEGMPADIPTVTRIVTEGYEPDGTDGQKAAGQYDAIMAAQALVGHGPLTPEDIAGIHRALMIRHDPNGGHYRTVDKSHTGYGTASTIRKPVSPRESRYALNSLCKAYNAAMRDPRTDKLILALCTTLDLFTISPFANGNGRMYRLILGMLLEESGIRIQRYASLERQIYLNLSDHLLSLERSSDGWSGDFFGYTFFIGDMLRNLHRCASELERSFPHPKMGKVSKADRLRHVMASMDSSFTKSDLARYAPDVSMVTVQQAVSSALSDGTLRKIGNTKGCRYVMNRQV